MPSPVARGHYDLALYDLAVRHVAHYSAPSLPPEAGMPDEWEVLAKVSLIAAGQGAAADPAFLDELGIQQVVRDELTAPGTPLEVVTRVKALAFAEYCVLLGLPRITFRDCLLMTDYLMNVAARLFPPVVFKEGKRAAVEALLEKLDLDVGRSFLYSDSSADVPLFEEVGNPVVVNPKAPFREVARRRGWEVVEWRERNRPGAEPDLADEWGSWGG